jgi:hypothetical protein
MRYSQSLANMIADCLIVDVKKRANLDTLLQINRLHLGKEGKPTRPNTSDRKML